MSTDLIREARVEAAVMRKPPIARPDRLRLIERLADALERAEKERDEERIGRFTAEDVLLEIEVELRWRASVFNEVGQVEPPYTTDSLLSMADLARDALARFDEEDELRREADMPC